MCEAIVAGIVGGLFASALWAGIAAAWLFSWRHRRYRGLAGRYRIRRKLEPDVVCEELHISVSGNVLEATSDDYDGGRYKATPGRPTSGNACLSVGSLSFANRG